MLAAIICLLVKPHRAQRREAHGGRGGLASTVGSSRATVPDSRLKLGLERRAEVRAGRLGVGAGRQGGRDQDGGSKPLACCVQSWEGASGHRLRPRHLWQSLISAQKGGISEKAMK